jgi:hypothetical protein
MATIQETRSAMVVEEKEAKFAAAESTSDLELESSSLRRPGSIWTIIGCALANFSDGYQQNLVRVLQSSSQLELC